ncbi:MAG: hypothetical protein R3F58_05135 [Steroidobacteraceae bacterium]
MNTRSDSDDRILLSIVDAFVGGTLGVVFFHLAGLPEGDWRGYALAAIVGVALLLGSIHLLRQSGVGAVPSYNHTVHRPTILQRILRQSSNGVTTTANGKAAGI